MHSGIRALCLLLTTVVLTSCQPSTSESAQTSTDRETPSVAALMDRYLEQRLQWLPQDALSYDDGRFLDRYSALGPDTRQALSALTVKTLAELAAIDPHRLSDDERLNYDYLLFDLQLAKDGEAFAQDELPLNQLDNELNYFAQLGSGLDLQPFRQTRDYDAFLSKIAQFVLRCDQIIAWQQSGLQHGVVLPKILVERLLPQLQAHLVANPEQSVFFTPLKSFPSTVSESDQARLIKAYRTAIQQHIIPAYQKMLHFLQHDYLPQARLSDGWSALPNGSAWYQYLIRRHTSLRDLSAEQIHQLGLNEVARIHNEMQKVRLQLNVKGDLTAVFTLMKTDPTLRFNSADEALNAYRDIKQKIDAALPPLFQQFPHSSYEVRRVEHFREASSASAQYNAGSADGSRPGIFYVNLFDLKLQPRYGVTTLSLHEAAPGHHFQTMLAIENTALPKYRRYATNTAFDEGWALYAESLGYEMGLFDDPIQRYGNLSDELLRALRLVVDTGLHSKGWTRAQAIAYMTMNSSLADHDIQNEVERYMATPAQALAYKLGQLKLRALRQEAEQALGSRFDIKAFHQQLLAQGSLPLPVLEQQLNRWIQRQQRL